MMSHYVNKFKLFCKKFTENKKSYFRLTSITKKNGVVTCEFEDILNICCHPISIDIRDIFKDKNIQKKLSPETLLIIGETSKKNQYENMQYRVKITDLVNKTILLENQDEKLTIKIYDLLFDELMLSKINQMDLIRVICPLMYKNGYDDASKISLKFSVKDDSLAAQKEETNIIHLFSRAKTG